MFEITSHSELETKKIGKIIASKLEKGDTLLLLGELGVRENKINRRNINIFRFTKRNI